jgi:hypothetical protein
MARRVRPVTSEPTETKRNRRTPEQIVADLEAELEAVNAGRRQRRRERNRTRVGWLLQPGSSRSASMRRGGELLVDLLGGREGGQRVRR